MKIPVHPVTGAPGSGKSALIARLVASRNRWLGLVNMRAAGAPPRLHELPPGCPCCTGRVMLQAALTRLLRQVRPERVLVEMTGANHDRALLDVLAGWPLSKSIEGGRALQLPQDALLVPEYLDRA